MNLQEELRSFEFSKKGTITITADKDHPTFNLLDLSETLEGNVYLWVIETNETPTEIIYIGKAGKTIARRCMQHLGGFRGKKGKGLKNSINLLKLLNTGTQIAIYGRHSTRMQILGQDNISLCDAEESALIAKYKNNNPLFNKY